MGQVGNCVSVALAIVTLVLRLLETGVIFADPLLKEEFDSDSIENGRRVRPTICSGTPGRYTGSVSLFYLNFFGKWSGTNGHY